MAYGDTYTSQPGSEGDGADKTVSYEYNPMVAQGNPFLTEYPKEQRLFLEDAERAAAAGVTGVDKIEYAEAMQNYESRPDVELLINRRAREAATTFGAQDFTRQAVQIATPLQSSTVGTTSVVKGDDYSDGVDAGTQDDVVVQPDRT